MRELSRRKADFQIKFICIASD
jgi:hypothetical protein